MKVGEAMKAIQDMGMTVTRRDGEFRVNLKGGTEATAYYTTDADDAVCSAKAMLRIAAMRHIEVRVRLV